MGRLFSDMMLGLADHPCCRSAAARMSDQKDHKTTADQRKIDCLTALCLPHGARMCGSGGDLLMAERARGGDLSGCCWWGYETLAPQQRTMHGVI